MVRQLRGLAARWKYFWQSVAGSRPRRSLYYTADRAGRDRAVPAVLEEFALPLSAFGFIVLAYFVIVGMSNAVNLTDGLDGLAIMPAVLVAGALGVFAYASGNAMFAHYLQIPYIRGAGELLIFCAALAGAGLGFLWFNSYPAQVFMGDIGALALGAALGMHRGDRAPGDRAAGHGRRVRARDRVGDPAGRLVQAHRQAHLPHGADPPSLRAQGLGRAEGDRAFLDHQR